MRNWAHSAALMALSTVYFAYPASSQVIITQANANAGNVTPGDAAGFPVTLSAPGSYVLGSNLIPGAGRDGIVAASSDISIDLNGFRLSGGAATGGAGNSRHGIIGRGDRLTVFNGTIGGFNGTGILVPNQPYLVVEDMRVINNGSGISNDTGNVARIQNSTVSTNRGTGIRCGNSCRIAQNVITSNMGSGVECLLACHAEGNVVSFNGSTGLTMRTGTALGNTIVSNSYYGLNTYISQDVVGYGNNTIANNNAGGDQINDFGSVFKLFPNVCYPGAC